MYVITSKEDNSIFYITKAMKEKELGYKEIVGFGFCIKVSDWGVFEVEEITENVTPGKYCYTEEKGFYENPNWVEPEIEDPIQEYRDQLASEVSEIGYNA